jgi:preprotein translocase subunit SecY
MNPASCIFSRSFPANMGRRLFVTLGALFIFRLGSSIPVFGLDLSALERFASYRGALDRVSIFALGVMPIFSVLMLLEMAKLVFPSLGLWETAKPRNAWRLQAYVFAAALVLAAFQALAVAKSLESVPGLVDEQGVVATLVGATALLAWLADLATIYGMGNGFWLLLIAPSLDRAPRAAENGFTLWTQRGVGGFALIAAAGFIALSIALLVVATKTHSLPTPAPASPAAIDKSPIRDDAFAHVWPPLLAVYVGGVLAVAVLHGAGGEGPAHPALIALLIASFTYMRNRQAANRPGCAQRPVWTMALVQIFVCVGGELLTRRLGLPFTIDGSWLVLIVAVAMSCLAFSEAEPGAEP